MIESWVNYIRFVQLLSLKLAWKYELASYDFIRQKDSVSLIREPQRLL